jgi:alpha,alpha-trehalase
MPVLTRALLYYRYRRLDEARRAAREAGLKGAMFPWQSGSNGREESQRIHLNPMSGRWVPDNSWRQRHIGAAICYNLWQYFQATEDRDFLIDYGAELFCEIARFWSSLSKRRPDGRFDIDGVMGPDEFHTSYPGVDPAIEGGLKNNAYTNVMVSWLLSRVFDVLDLIPSNKRRRLCERLELKEEEFDRWREISGNLAIAFHDDGIISQFEGYDELREFDWEGCRRKYDDLQRLDRILETEGEDPNHYKASKQADVLMIFYLFSREEIEEIFHRLGYSFSPDLIFKNIQYYTRRTSHGSSLSWVTHAWVLARADRQRSWQLAQTALAGDIADLQGGTTREGIHLGAMAGTVDLIQRCYSGIEMRDGVLAFNPRLPDEMQQMSATLRYRRHTLDVEITQDCLTISSRVMTAHPITIAYRSHIRELSPGQTFTFDLVEEHKPDRTAREREQERACKGRTVEGTEDRAA